MIHTQRSRSPSRASKNRTGVGLRGRPRIRMAIAGLALALTAIACQPSAAPGEEPEGWVEIRGKRIAVDVADNPREQAKGLGERDELAWDHGMIFLYERPAFYSFWMKGMRFSIDIIWIREGRIIDMDLSVPFEPGGNGPTVRPDSLVDSVLEVPSGYALANGWRIGDRVVFEREEPSS